MPENYKKISEAEHFAGMGRVQEMLKETIAEEIGKAMPDNHRCLHEIDIALMQQDIPDMKSDINKIKEKIEPIPVMAETLNLLKSKFNGWNPPKSVASQVMSSYQFWTLLAVLILGFLGAIMGIK